MPAPPGQPGQDIIDINRVSSEDCSHVIITVVTTDIDSIFSGYGEYPIYATD